MDVKIAQDVLQSNHEEIVYFATRKYHPDLNQAFKEAGMPFITEEARLGGMLIADGDGGCPHPSV